MSCSEMLEHLCESYVRALLLPARAHRQGSGVGCRVKDVGVVSEATGKDFRVLPARVQGRGLGSGSRAES